MAGTNYPGGTYPGGGFTSAAVTPTVVKPANQTGRVLDSPSLQIEPTGQASYGASGLPAGLSVNSATGLITGTLTTVETPTVTVKAFNGEGTEASTTFTWTVSAALAPTVSKPADQSTEKGIAASLFVEATSTSTYTASGLPAGLSINSATGQITGTPTTVGAAKTVTIKVAGPTAPEAETTFKWTITTPTVVTPTTISPSRPPLGLQAELVYPDGTTARWDSDARRAKDRPSGISFKTQRYTGFADAQITLNRRIDRDYPDLGLLDGINLVGYDGSVGYEGRIGSMPRSMEGTPQITVQAQGWMSHAKDQPFTEVYVDRDLSKWVGPSRRRTVALRTGNYDPGNVGQLNDETGQPVVELGFGGSWVSPYKPIAEAWWLPQPGISIGALAYDFAAYNTATMSAGDANWGVLAILNSDDNGSERDEASLWPTTGTIHYLTAAGARTTANLELAYSGTPAGTQGASYYAHFSNLAVYGTHGLERRGADPGGFYVSDMIRDIASRWAPKLDTSQIDGTTLPVPHASFLAETLPYDAWQSLNAYHRWEMAVYEKRRLLYYPIDLTDYDWQVRLSDPGTTVSLQGDDVGNLCNGVVVRYRSIETGYETRLTPAAHSQLRDESPDNPANLNGLPLYTTLSLSVPTSETVALEVGRIYLAEFNQAKSPGSITIKGHIKDGAGHWQQGWKVRAGERLVITDLPNGAVRVVGETSWDHSSKTLTIAVDSSFKRLDAILARLGNAVDASGLSLP